MTDYQFSEMSKNDERFHRAAWTGLTQAELERPGATLIALLLRKANLLGLQLQELAARLGCTYSYIA